MQVRAVQLRGDVDGQLAVQQQEVHDLADGGDRVAVLGQPHGAHNDAAGGGHVIGQLPDLLLRQPAQFLDLRPVQPAPGRHSSLEAALPAGSADRTDLSGQRALAARARTERMTLRRAPMPASISH